MQTEHLQNVRPSWVAFGWFAAAAVTGLALVGLSVVGLIHPAADSGSGCPPHSVCRSSPPQDSDSGGGTLGNATGKRRTMAAIRCGAASRFARCNATDKWRHSRNCWLCWFGSRCP